MRKERRAYFNEDRCVCCGAVIPEGRMVCPACENSEADRSSDELNGEGYLEGEELLTVIGSRGYR